MPSTRASKSSTCSGLQHLVSPPPSSARKNATSLVVSSTKIKKPKVDDKTVEKQMEKGQKTKDR
jgi:hypothetical protein